MLSGLFKKNHRVRHKFLSLHTRNLEVLLESNLRSFCFFSEIQLASYSLHVFLWTQGMRPPPLVKVYQESLAAQIYCP